MPGPSTTLSTPPPLPAPLPPSATPPKYEVADSSTEQGRFVKSAAESFVKFHTAEDGTFNRDDLCKSLDIFVREINVATGVTIPRLNTGASNNPINPDGWSWSDWEQVVCPKSWEVMPYLNKCKISSTLFTAIGDNEESILALNNHPIFREFLTQSGIEKISNTRVNTIIKYTRLSQNNPFVQLFDEYSIAVTSKSFKPTAMIKAAIELGYLTKEEIEILFHIEPCNSELPSGLGMNFLHSQHNFGF